MLQLSVPSGCVNVAAMLIVVIAGSIVLAVLKFETSHHGQVRIAEQKPRIMALEQSLLDPSR